MCGGNVIIAVSTTGRQWVLAATEVIIAALSLAGGLARAGDFQISSSPSDAILWGQEGQPLVAGNMMYFETSFPTYIYAVNLSDVAHTVWSYPLAEADTAPATACCRIVSRGLAYASGKILANSPDGRVLELDAKSGKELWKVISVDGQSPRAQISAPVVIRDEVIIHVAGLENYLRGYLTAFDLTTGRRKWRAYATGSDADTLIDSQLTVNAATQKPVGEHPALATCSAKQSNLEGAPPRDWVLYDAQLNLLYDGSGTPGTCIRAGASNQNQWGVTIFARRPATGAVVWVYQTLQPGSWDFNAANQNLLVDLTVTGRHTPALVHFDPDGFTYVLDRRNGRLIGAHLFDPEARLDRALQR